ncbi:MAG: transposase [Saprospiraceae bacterium]|nr:transposase [Saprospiraceae bacterium]
MTNILDLPAEMVGAVYRHRLQIEVFFRFLKQEVNLTTLCATMSTLSKC